MDEYLHELLAYIIQKELDVTELRAMSIAVQFGDLEEFLETDPKKLREVKSISSKHIFKIPDEQIEGIRRIQESDLFDPQKSLKENYINAISREFTKKQVVMIRGCSLDQMNPNPFLIQSLNLKTPEEILHLNVYMFVTRSMVTSMGYFIEDLLDHSSIDITKLKGGEKGWDLKKRSANSKYSYIQVKSGPNDMDKDQVVYWAKKIADRVKKGDDAFIGFTYGKRSNDTVTIGLLRQHIENWEEHTLFGRDLWEFVGDDPQYPDEVFEQLKEAAHKVLGNKSIEEEIVDAIDRMLENFTERYGEGEDGIKNYIDEIF